MNKFENAVNKSCV